MALFQSTHPCGVRLEHIVIAAKPFSFNPRTRATIIGELTEDANPELALAQYKTAIKHDAKSGVKGSIKRLEKQLGSSAETEEATDE